MKTSEILELTDYFDEKFKEINDKLDKIIEQNDANKKTGDVN